MPLIAPKLKIPGAVAEILYGVIIGKSFLDLIHLEQGGLVSFLADFGFVVLMFLAGLEIEFGDLKNKGIRGMKIPTISFTISLILSVIAIFVFRLPKPLIFIVTATGVGLIIPVLKELNITKAKIGQEIFLFALVAELLTLLIFTIFEIYQHNGISWQLLQLPLMIIVAIVFLKILYTIAWWYPERLYQVINPHDSKQIGVRLSFLLMFILVAIAIFFKIEFIIGALIAGIIISATFKEKEVLEEKMSAIGYGFLIPIFFINIGLNFDISAALKMNTITIFIQLFFIALFVKLISGLFLTFHEISLRNSFASGFLLAAPLTLLVAIGMIELRLGLIDEITNNAIILLAMVTSILYPILFKVIYKKEKVYN